MKQTILMVVAKEPIAGKTKTRLAKDIGFESAATLYRCLLRDVLAIVQQIPNITPAVLYHPATAQETFRTLAPGFALVLQEGNNLGERLDNAITTCLANGYHSVAVLSSDNPLVDPHAITQGFAALEQGYDIALGPCDDGGYYLLAANTPCPTLLRDIQMSTPHVTSETIAAANHAGFKLLTLPATYDIDTLADLERFRKDMLSLPGHVARHTREWVKREMGCVMRDA